MITFGSINISDSTRISKDEILNHLKDNCSLSIEVHGADKVLLVEINERLKGLKNVGLTLVCDYLHNPSSGYVNNLDVLLHLNNIQRLTIFNHSSARLETLENIGCLPELKRFSLNGFFKDNISLKSLFPYKLESFSIEAMAGVQVYKLLDLNRSLKELSINSLDLQRIERFEDLSYLSVNNSLKNSEMMCVRFPNIKSLQLKLIKGISDFSFISTLHRLSNLSLMYTGITSMPTLKADKMSRIRLVSNKGLRDISSIWELKSLEQLYISYSELLNTEDLERCLRVPNLRRACFLSAKVKRNKAIQDIFNHSKVEFDTSTANDYPWF
ncbi:MAG: hypothetical protein K2L22_06350 [Muribaculaceae bacterium]|nr:hypothetical protein [Muribaculaceae bacterium]